MGNAGRILIMPKGNYAENRTYEMLDLVKHNGTSWLAKKTVKGIEPSNANEEYWQNLFDINGLNDVGSVDFGVGTIDEFRVTMSKNLNGASYSSSIPLTNAKSRNIVINSYTLPGEPDHTSDGIEKFIIEKFDNSFCIYIEEAYMPEHIEGNVIGISYTAS